jgi:hypothetical protein
MLQTDARSLQQIKRETEQTRAGLTDTVEQLHTSVAETASDIRHRISPDATRPRYPTTSRVGGAATERRHRRRPQKSDADCGSRGKRCISAAATGSDYTFANSVGAGLFFAGSKTGQAAAQKASGLASDLSDQVSRRAHDLGSQVGESVSAAETYAADQLDRVSAAVSGGADQGGRAAKRPRLRSLRIQRSFKRTRSRSEAQFPIVRPIPRTLLPKR